VNSSTFDRLNDTDMEWLYRAGTDLRLSEGAEVITAGQPATALLIVIEGVLSVFLPSRADAPIATLGPGEVVGDMTLLEDRPPSVSVTCKEATQVLSIPHDVLRRRFTDDLEFARRFYEGMAITLSQRLRQTSSRLAAARLTEQDLQAAGGAWKTVSEAVARIKRRLVEIDTQLKQAKQRPGQSLPAAPEIEEAQSFFRLLQQEIGDDANENALVKEEIGAYVQQELLPFVLLTRFAERSYSKPRGYAGDYHTIAILYENKPTGIGRIGPLIDQYFLECPPAQAVRNRRALMCEEIEKTVESCRGRTAQVTSLACGPATEVFDVFGHLPDPGALTVNLLDIDLQALAYVSEKRDEARLQSRMRLLNDNLIYLALGRTKTDIRDQDLIYSIGLIDYFNDKIVVKLMNLIHSMLRPGGRVILGNFHPRNDCKAMMDYVLDWSLIHRTEADMDRLYQISHFGRPCTKIRFEEQRINLFAECVRAE
jgi:extracellular factor (EF) 3-hydroxypalmitic acid methyl ester biosynthesis protein